MVTMTVKKIYIFSQFNLKNSFQEKELNSFYTEKKNFENNGRLLSSKLKQFSRSIQIFTIISRRKTSWC